MPAARKAARVGSNSRPRLDDATHRCAGRWPRPFAVRGHSRCRARPGPAGRRVRHGRRRRRGAHHHRGGRCRARGRGQYPRLPDADPLPGSRRRHRRAGAPARRPCGGRGRRRDAAFRLLRAGHPEPDQPRRHAVDRAPARQAGRAGDDGIGGRAHHRARRRRAGTARHRRLERPAARQPPRPPGLRPTSQRPAAGRARHRLPRRGADPSRADGEPAWRARRAALPRARDRRALPVRRGVDRAGRDRRGTAATLRPLRDRAGVLHHAHAQHPVRAAGQQLFLDRDDHAGRARPRDADRAGDHPRRPQQAAPLLDQRRLRHRHGDSRPLRLGQSPRQRPGASPALRGDGFRRAAPRSSPATSSRSATRRSRSWSSAPATSTRNSATSTAGAPSSRAA